MQEAMDESDAPAYINSKSQHPQGEDGPAQNDEGTSKEEITPMEDQESNDTQREPSPRSEQVDSDFLGFFFPPRMESDVTKVDSPIEEKDMSPDSVLLSTPGSSLTVPEQEEQGTDSLQEMDTAGGSSQPNINLLDFERPLSGMRECPLNSPRTWTVQVKIERSSIGSRAQGVRQQGLRRDGPPGAGGCPRSSLGALGTIFKRAMRQQRVPRHPMPSVELANVVATALSDDEIAKMDPKEIDLMHKHLISLLHVPLCNPCFYELPMDGRRVFGPCNDDTCEIIKELVTHMRNCRNLKDCSYPVCLKSWRLIGHFAKCCKLDSCPLCKSLREEFDTPLRVLSINMLPGNLIVIRMQRK